MSQPETKILPQEDDGDFDDIDWGSDADAPIVASCDLSNPEVCESCQ